MTPIQSADGWNFSTEEPIGLTEPYYKTKSGSLYLGDSREMLRLMEDDSVSITVTSPPYNMGTAIHHQDDVYLEYKDNLSQKEYFDFIDDIVSELLRVTKYYVFLNFAFLSNNNKTYFKLIGKYQNEIKEFFTWAKTNPPPPVSDGVLSQGFEAILCLSKFDNDGRKFKRYFFDDHRTSNTIIKSSYKKFVEGHFACYPEWLPSFFIKNFTERERCGSRPIHGQWHNSGGV